MFKNLLPWRTFGILLVLSLNSFASNAADKQCLVLLLHGKWGSAQPMVPFGRKLSSVCDYKSIEMPWSQRRLYDVTYDVALQEINNEVLKAREAKYRLVYLAGQSFGANAALAYMTLFADVDGAIALSPGHAPAGMYRQGIGKDAVNQARKLVDEKQADTILTMDDLNQGQRRPIKMTAGVLKSYFDPEGLGNMTLTAGNFKKNVPVLMVLGSSDSLASVAKDAIFNKLPKHEKSQFIVVDAGHFDALDAASEQVKLWLEAIN